MDQAAGSGVSLDAQLSSIVFPAGVNAKHFKAMYNQYRLQMQQLSIRPDQDVFTFLTGISAIQDSIDYLMEICQTLATAIDNIDTSDGDGTGGQTSGATDAAQDAIIQKMTESVVKEAAGTLGTEALGGVAGGVLSAGGSAALAKMMAFGMAGLGGLVGVVGAIAAIKGMADLFGSDSTSGGGGVGSTTTDKYTTVNQMAQVLYSIEMAVASLVNEEVLNTGRFKVVNLSLGSLLTQLTNLTEYTQSIFADVSGVLLPGRLLTDARVTVLEGQQVDDMALIYANAGNIATNSTQIQSNTTDIATLSAQISASSPATTPQQVYLCAYHSLPNQGGYLTNGNWSTGYKYMSEIQTKVTYDSTTGAINVQPGLYMFELSYSSLATGALTGMTFTLMDMATGFHLFDPKVSNFSSLVTASVTNTQHVVSVPYAQFIYKAIDPAYVRVQLTAGAGLSGTGVNNVWLKFSCRELIL